MERTEGSRPALSCRLSLVYEIQNLWKVEEGDRENSLGRSLLAEDKLHLLLPLLTLFLSPFSSRAP